MATNQTADHAAAAWSELLGSNNWDGLLDPLDINLRTLILRCGNFCQATYDAFNNEEKSKYCGSSRYGKHSLFDKVMLQDAANYQVYCFLYASAQVSVPEALLLHPLSRESWDRESNWMGYIAVTSDQVSQANGRREIYIAWRGTTRNYEWVDVLGAKLESAASLLRPDSSCDEVPKVMRGWLSMYISDNPKSPFMKFSVRDQLRSKINEIRQKYKNQNLSITLTGHSLGACLATLSAFDLVENGVSDIPVAAFVFESPQVGNKAFKSRIERYPNLKILHTKNTIDPISLYPSALLGYVDVGTQLVIDSRKSPFLKESKDAWHKHNLEGVLHVVAGWNGEKGEFELKVKRSVALVNKSTDLLKEECHVPASWWVEKNRGMVLDESSGEWVLAPPSDEDLPVLES